jgi:ribosomal protein S18 acetylase RimI-like enzyme
VGQFSTVGTWVIIQPVATPALVTAIEANLFAFFSLFRFWSQADMHDDPDMLWTITNIPFPMFNNVLHAQLTPDNLDAAIEVAIGRCRSRNVPMMWWTGPATKPADLAVRLEAHGFVGEHATGMAADLGSLPGDLPMPLGFVIEGAADIQATEKWCRALCAGYGMPDFVGEAFLDFCSSLGFGQPSSFWKYTGWLSGQAVSTASMFLGAGVAGIYNVATLPNARRKGIGAATTLVPLREAQAQGYRAAVLHSSEMGLGVYRRLGFREYCDLGIYEWPGEGSGADPG